MPPNQQGHNSGVAPDAFLNHFRACMATKRALDEAQAAHRHEMKRAKGAGIALDAFKSIMKERKEDPEEIEARERAKARYRAWLGMPVGFQTSLLDGVPLPGEDAREAHEDWAAEEAGYEAGKHGASSETIPFDEPELKQAWLDGWKRGAALNGTDQPKKRRGRRAAAGNPEEAAAA